MLVVVGVTRRSGMAEYTKYIAIDFGTSGCTIALGFVEPNPNKILVYTSWSELKKAVDVKCPSILLVSPLKKFENFGEEAFKRYSKLSKDDAKKYYYFYRFKMKLYSTPVSFIRCTSVLLCADTPSQASHSFCVTKRLAQTS